ncbi:MAG: hypothetical protein ABI366_06030 [Ginsengibacter sp.]
MKCVVVGVTNLSYNLEQGRMDGDLYSWPGFDIAGSISNFQKKTL